MDTVYRVAEGVTRRQAALALSRLVGSEMQYLGAPSMRYQIGDVDITRDGAIEGRMPFEVGTILIENEILCQVPAPSRHTITVDTRGWDERQHCNLGAMVHARGELIGKALGVAPVTIRYLKDKQLVEFAWLPENPDPEVLKAVEELIQAMIRQAGKLSRASSKPPKPGNDKYAMRTFLLRLGFIGEKSQNVRRVLTQNLTGSSAWADWKPITGEVAVNS